MGEYSSGVNREVKAGSNKGVQGRGDQGRGVSVQRRTEVEGSGNGAGGRNVYQ